MDNTLLNRCTLAYQEAIASATYPAHTTRTHRAGVASVLEHLAAELLVLTARGPLSAHDVARLLIDAAKQPQGAQ